MPLTPDIEAILKRNAARVAPPIGEATEAARAVTAAIDDHVRKLALVAARRKKRKAGPYFQRPVFRGTGSVGGVPADSLAVHPKQVEEAVRFCKDRGVPTDYTPGGRPVIRSAAHQKAHAKIRGFRPQRGY